MPLRAWVSSSFASSGGVSSPEGKSEPVAWSIIKDISLGTFGACDSVIQRITSKCFRMSSSRQIHAAMIVLPMPPIPNAPTFAPAAAPLDETATACAPASASSVCFAACMPCVLCRFERIGGTSPGTLASPSVAVAWAVAADVVASCSRRASSSWRRLVVSAADSEVAPGGATTSMTASALAYHTQPQIRQIYSPCSARRGLVCGGSGGLRAHLFDDHRVGGVLVHQFHQALDEPRELLFVVSVGHPERPRRQESQPAGRFPAAALSINGDDRNFAFFGELALESAVFRVMVGLREQRNDAGGAVHPLRHAVVMSASIPPSMSIHVRTRRRCMASRTLIAFA